MPLAIVSAVAISSPQIDPDKPKSVAFAKPKACVGSVAFKIIATGPKNSSLKAGILLVTSLNIVGA